MTSKHARGSSSRSSDDGDCGSCDGGHTETSALEAFCHVDLIPSFVNYKRVPLRAVFMFLATCKQICQATKQATVLIELTSLKQLCAFSQYTCQWELKALTLRCVLTTLDILQQQQSQLGQFCTTVTALDFTGSCLAKSLEQLPLFVNLRSLTLTLCRSYGDLRPLQSLQKLCTLNLTNTRVNDVSVCNTLPNLKALYLQACPIVDLRNFCFQSLKCLDISQSLVRDITPISLVANSLEYLNVCYTEIDNLSPVASLPCLKSLRICRTNVIDLSPLAKSYLLEKLDMSCTSVSDISALTTLTNLKQVDASCTMIDSSLPFRSLKKLQKLNLFRTELADVSHLSSLTNLTYLNIGRTGVNNISLLQNLTKLIYLNVGYTQIVEFKVLQNFKQLRMLNLQSTTILNIEPLKSLTKMQSLKLDYSNVCDVSHLTKMLDLKELGLTGTQVTDLVPLQELQKLQNKSWMMYYGIFRSVEDDSCVSEIAR